MVKTKQGLRVIGTQHPDLDVTGQLHRFSEAMAEKLEDIGGYILN
jgi:hypothetical protein